MAESISQFQLPAGAHLRRSLEQADKVNCQGRGCACVALGAGKWMRGRLFLYTFWGACSALGREPMLSRDMAELKIEVKLKEMLFLEGRITYLGWAWYEFGQITLDD